MANVKLYSTPKGNTEILVNDKRLDHCTSVRFTKDVDSIGLFEFEVRDFPDVVMEHAKVDISITGQSIQDAAKIVSHEIGLRGDWYEAMKKGLAACLESNFSYIKTGDKMYEEVAKDFIDNYFL